MSGAPPERYRCQAKRRCGLRCGKWALKGRNYCQFHGGRRRHGYRGMGRYSKHLGKTLNKMVEELMSEAPHEQLALYEELALARTASIEAIKLWDAAQGPDVKMETKALAASALRESLVFVRDMVVAAAHVEERARDKVSLYAVQAMVAQVVRAVHDVCPDEALADRIEARIKERVRVPTATTAGGTDSTPDQVVAEMDAATAPAPPRDEEA